MHETLPDPVTAAAARFPDRTAILSDAPWTYTELERRVRAFAAALDTMGVSGRRVALLLPNVQAFPAAFHGILRAGASAVLLNPLYSPREVAEYVADSRAAAAVTTRDLAHLLPPGIPTILIDAAMDEIEMPGDARQPAPPHAASSDGASVDGASRASAERASFASDSVDGGTVDEARSSARFASTESPTVRSSAAAAADADPVRAAEVAARAADAILADELALGDDREAAVIYTSAVSGWARGARLTHRSLGANLAAVMEAMQIGEGDRVVTLLPLIHAFGLTVTLNAPLAAGATVLPVERFHPVRLLELLEETQATVLCGVPAMYMAILAAAERRGVPRHSVKAAICGGAPLPEEVSARWEAMFGVPLREGYGLTEASPVCLFNRLDRPNRRGTMGYPFPGVSVTIRDERGDVLPTGAVGEICVAGENVFAGYVGEGGRNVEDFHGEWLRTGDLGSMSQDGAVTFHGCLKPMFTRSGFNIYPAEIERVLLEDPRIAAITVEAVPDAAKENDIALTIRPAPGAALTEDDVRHLCQSRLAAYKQPSTITLDPPAAQT
ncbi:MAG TPA: AMP-binding protein [Longimicrobiaceae bacterium]|jgi:long-chain acyl-CoA synthetase|nr:AMP-binding protein [Longimicrobiaceae bacterium]